ncbi:uncharacterized protein A1O9_06420 [Exophiala aquamarina CBS 119918]|uniref:Xylanolytic transcriptional activator regulatory domain-containing protein n=1 Tax=Exophiala aquamarina CBS 119918 TaxID=1182545 RepID=A0A072PEG4_9EURO|nr:uncharacterized protein A1O9_06420 [Exophiala aquamarina CBS 119918]KEF58494.1 hypothetical protein A1O9_06420 [Exophiala aquamarina CBS 119918]
MRRVTIPRKIEDLSIASLMVPFERVTDARRLDRGAQVELLVGVAAATTADDHINFGNDAQSLPLAGQFGQLVFATTGDGHFPSQDKLATRNTSITETFHNDGIQYSNAGRYDQSTSSVNYSSSNRSRPSVAPAVVDLGALDPATNQMVGHEDFTNAQMSNQYPGDFTDQAESYDYPTFDEPLNWIPPSIYPSPYDAELEQDFSFILPTLSDTPDLGQDFTLALPIDGGAQFYHVAPNAPLETARSHELVPAALGPEQSPASSTSDNAMFGNKSTHSISHISDPKRKKRKPSLIPDIFSAPRVKRTTYSFPENSDDLGAASSSSSPDYCTQDIYKTIASSFQALCLQESFAHRGFETSTFPSIGDLNYCLALYFEYFHPTYPLIHLATFGWQTHWLVILAVATIGSNFIKSQRTVDLRDAFQEFLRRAVYQHAESAPDGSIDIPLAQARILNLIGLIQADREQLRALAPRYHADLSRWCLESGVLQMTENFNLPDAMMEPSERESPTEIWENWIRLESLRRIGYMSWMLDCCLGYMANARPLCNMDDARTPMPCSEVLWDAFTADTWYGVFQKTPQTPSLCVGLETLYSKKKVDPTYSDLSHILLIHTLYQRTWEVGTHIKQPLSEWVPTGKARGFLNTPTKDNFWLPLYPLYANWRNSACDCLDVIHWQASSTVAKASGIEHGVVLHLHLARIVLLTPFQEIQDLLFCLIGKVDNSSKASFYVHDGSYQPRNSTKLPQIRKIIWRWLREDQHKARLAMVHAGSVFWYVRRYYSASFYEPISVYLASLVLWTYGSYQNAALERDAAIALQRPEGGPSGPDAGATVQSTRMERKEHPVKFIAKAAANVENPPVAVDTNRTTSTDSMGKDNLTSPGAADRDARGPSQSSAQQAADSDSEDNFSSSDEQPEFIHLDRPCDDEIVHHFVRNGHNMSGHMSNVGDICKAPHKVLLEGAKLLRTRLPCWGVSREYYDILNKLAELRKAG